ncbi:MAG: agmatinase [Bacteroidetes bacterium]|nr:agmatinase [Bacteroidota bacterium]
MHTLDTESNFLGLDASRSSLEGSKIAIVSAPYERTVSYGHGTAGGPQAILAASHFVEFWDEEFQRDIGKDIGIAALAPIDFTDATDEAALSLIEDQVRRLLGLNKFVVTLGGEHSISAAPVRAYLEKYPEITVLQIDAHSDLRESYEGNPLSHASVMARICESVSPGRVVQVGIRAQCQEEFERIRKEGIHTFFSWKIRQGLYGQSWMERVLDALGEQVYITFDIDGLDPSIMPSTGTPEPGGLLWDETIRLLKLIGKHRHIAGFDLVELAPVAGTPGPDFLAAKLVSKILNAAFANCQSGTDAGAGSEYTY